MILLFSEKKKCGESSNWTSICVVLAGKFNKIYEHTNKSIYVEHFDQAKNSKTNR